MPELLLADSVGGLVDLLSRQFGMAVDRAVIAFYVAAAAQDLRGSICSEALPEMACKLAGHRLAEFTGEQRLCDPARYVPATAATTTTTTRRRGRVG